MNYVHILQSVMDREHFQTGNPYDLGEETWAAAFRIQ